MIDIRHIVAEIDGLSISDREARRAAIHEHVRNYGVELLMNLANAILPNNESELAAVQWLRGEITKIAAQIPQSVSPSKKD